MLLEKKKANDMKVRDKDFSSSQFADDTASYFDESKKGLKISKFLMTSQRRHNVRASSLKV